MQVQACDIEQVKLSGHNSAILPILASFKQANHIYNTTNKDIAPHANSVILAEKLVDALKIMTYFTQ